MAAWMNGECPPGSNHTMATIWSSPKKVDEKFGSKWRWIAIAVRISSSEKASDRQSEVSTRRLEVLTRKANR
jgi:hypothetical protein